MRVDATPAFAPVTITLETPEEVYALAALVGLVPAALLRGGYVYESLWSSLSNSPGISVDRCISESNETEREIRRWASSTHQYGAYTVIKA